MKISLKRKLGMTAIFVGVYLATAGISACIIGPGILHLIASALFAVPFGWMLRLTWSDD